MKRTLILCSFICVCAIGGFAQTDRILNFDYESDGPWNDPEQTAITAPKVPVGSIVLDGNVSAAEYGGFESMDLIPADSAWPLNWPGERQWDGPDDSSFKFYIAHDEDNVYIGVDVKDDVLSQDAEQSASFWQDDCIEVVIDAGNLIPPDLMGPPRALNGITFDWGAHTYFTYNEKMRGIDENGEDTINQSWIASEWTFGPDGDIRSKGSETASGWMLEVLIPKRLFMGTGLPFPWNDKSGQTYDIDLETMPLSFAIAVDDDDGKADVENTGFELQYWFPVTDRLGEEMGSFGEEMETWSSQEIENGDYLDWYGTVKGERLNGGSLGLLYLATEITAVGEWAIY